MPPRNKSYRPAPYVPSISMGGDEEPILLRAENMWLRSSRFGNPYAESFTGNLDLSETIATKTLTGTLAWDSTTKVVTGTGTAFLSEVRLGSFILGDGGAGLTELLVVEKVTSNTSITISKKPTATATGKTGYVLPVIFPVGSDRGTCISGNVLQFPTGHYLGVGDGTFRVNGTAITTVGKTFVDANVTTGTDNIAITGHGFSSGQQVTLTSTGTLPAGLSTNTIYYVLRQDTDNIKLSATLGGAAVDITAAAGGGTHTVTTGTGTSGTYGLSKLPQFALYDATANTYTQNDVGIDRPSAAITIAAVAVTNAIASSTNATPIVVTTASAHGLYNGQEITIKDHTTNTNANGAWTVTRLTATTFSLNGSVGNGVGGADGTISGGLSQMRAGDYNIRVCAKNTTTLGFSQPSDVIATVTLTAGQAIQITFNSAMLTDQDAYDIYGTPFEDNSTATIEARFMGPWFLAKTVTASQLISATPSATTGRESGATYILSYADAEIQTATQVMTFNNFPPVKSEFVDLINGIPIYFSCMGKGNTSNTTGTSPGPAAIPSKPSNPEAIFTNKTITTAGGDYIVGEFNAKSRIFVLGQNTLQTLILTTLDEEPITFRSLWSAGFRNPYNVAFVKEYLYGDSTQGVLRSVAGGDDSAIEFEFASDMRDIFVDEPCGHKLVAYDPKNKAMCFFYSAAERRSGYWVTLVRPFLIEKGIWNPPIVLRKTNTDFIVSGVATVGNQLVFLAGGRTSAGAISVGTYVFDGGDSETKDWYMAWNYSDDGAELNAKTIKGFTATGKFASASTAFKVYGLRKQGNYDTFDLASLADGTNSSASFTMNTTGGYFARQRFKFGDWGGYPLYAIRVSGSTTTVADRVDEIVVAVDVTGSVR